MTDLERGIRIGLAVAKRALRTTALYARDDRRRDWSRQLADDLEGLDAEAIARRSDRTCFDCGAEAKR